mmetsp:Transcript_102855/g.276251  ORF Transcript_102855/g.276251 Transcript_102855/m.276251 type:complete len:219 (-) Transcript_102855:1-657(-)
MHERPWRRYEAPGPSATSSRSGCGRRWRNGLALWRGSKVRLTAMARPAPFRPRRHAGQARRARATRVARAGRREEEDTKEERSEGVRAARPGKKEVKMARADGRGAASRRARPNGLGAKRPPPMLVAGPSEGEERARKREAGISGRPRLKLQRGQTEAIRQKPSRQSGIRHPKTIRNKPRHWKIMTVTQYDTLRLPSPDSPLFGRPHPTDSLLACRGS